MMDAEVFSIKQILIIVFLSCLMLFFITFVRNMSSRSTIAFCGEQSQLTIILENTRHEHLLISSSSVKNVLDCLGRVMPFSKRTIAYAVVQDPVVLSKIQKRYTIESDTLPESFGGIYIEQRSSSSFILSNDRARVYVYTRIPSSPFDELQSLKRSYDAVYTPLKRSDTAKLFEKLIRTTESLTISIQDGGLRIDGMLF